MNRIAADLLDATWKRILAAGLLSVAIVFAVGAFAESSYVQTQKVQLESERDQHCERWTYHKTDGETRVDCARWAR